MVAWDERYLPDVYECNVKSTGKRYRYNINNPTDEITGKWREVTGGGGSGGVTSYSELEDKPKINNVTLGGNKTLTDLGLKANLNVEGTELKTLEVDGTEYTIPEGGGTSDYDDLENTPVKYKTQEEISKSFTVPYVEEYEYHIITEDYEKETLPESEEELIQIIEAKYGFNLKTVKSFSLNGTTVTDFNYTYSTDHYYNSMINFSNTVNDEENKIFMIGINSLPDGEGFKKVYSIGVNATGTETQNLTINASGGYYEENINYLEFFDSLGVDNYEELTDVPVKQKSCPLRTYSQAISIDEDKGYYYWKDTVFFTDTTPSTEDEFKAWLIKHYKIVIDSIETIRLNSFYYRNRIEITFVKDQSSYFYFSFFSYAYEKEILRLGYDSQHFFIESHLTATDITALRISFTSSYYDVLDKYKNFFNGIKVGSAGYADNISTVTDNKIYTKIPEYTIDVDWNTVDWLGDGVGGGTYAETYKVTGEDVTPVNLQWKNEKRCIYLSIPDAIREVEITPDGKGFYIEGAGVWIDIELFNRKETTFKIWTSNQAFQVYVFNKKGLDNRDIYATVEEVRGRNKYLDFDHYPTENSINPVTSGGLYWTFSGKADKSEVRNIRKFTYIVDSDDALAYWLTNGEEGTSSGGSDFYSVLIKRGTWTYNGSAIATLNTIGTEFIEGECGAVIKRTGTGRLLQYTDVTTGVYVGQIKHKISNVHFEYVYTNTVIPLDAVLCGFCFVEDCSVNYEHSTTATYSNMGGGDGIVTNCQNLTNVNVTFKRSAPNISSVTVYGFSNCHKLKNCGLNRSDSNTSGSYNFLGFNSCNYLTNCFTYGYSMYTGYNNCKTVIGCILQGYGVAYGFSECYKVLNCSVNVSSYTSKYNKSYASSTATSSYLCGDTAAGGYNS